MRIAIITESFPPDVNGVAHCVVRVAEHLARNGHHPLVIAPESARASPAGADSQFPYPVERVPSVPLPGYPTFRLGLPSPRTRRAITGTAPNVVHLASPGRARRLGQPRGPGPGPADGRRLPDRPARLRPRLPAEQGDRGVRLALAARHPQRGRPDPRPVHADGGGPDTRTACERCGSGAAAWTRSASTPPGATPACARGSRPAARSWPATSGGWPPRSGSTCSRPSPPCRACGSSITGGGPEADELRRGHPGCGLPRRAARRRPGADLRQHGRVRAQRPVRDLRPDDPGGGRERPARGRARGRRPGGPGRRRGNRLTSSPRATADALAAGGRQARGGPGAARPDGRGGAAGRCSAAPGPP